MLQMVSPGPPRRYPLWVIGLRSLMTSNCDELENTNTVKVFYSIRVLQTVTS
jgi:hypothetical protein